MKYELNLDAHLVRSLQTGISVGRSNIKTVADKRLPEVKKFLYSLLHSASEIVNSDLVITFFHPLLRDQQEADIDVTKMRETRPANEVNICGEIKFSMHYHRNVFVVMVSCSTCCEVSHDKVIN